MARISQLKRQVTSDEKEKLLAILFTLLITCDLYILTKKETGVRLVAYLGLFSQDFIVKSEFELPQKLGDWLCSLPKDVWKKISNTLDDGKETDKRRDGSSRR
jgi:hypothetical protein